MAEIAALKDGNAWVAMITGHMFGGKSTELMRRLKSFHAASIISGFKWPTGDPDNLHLMVIKSTKDTRDHADVLKSHNGYVMSAAPYGKLVDAAASKQYALAQVIAVDEAHFFDGEPFDRYGISDELNQFVLQCIKDRKILIISALDGDFEGEPFMYVTKVLARCNEIHKLTTACKQCLSPACYSHNSKQRERLQAGDEADGYTCICHACWVKAYPKK